MSVTSFTVVIATNRPDSVNRWLEAWREEFCETTVLVIEDSPEKSFTLQTDGYADVRHVSWKEIDRELGARAWIIPRRSSAIKSYGFMIAYQEGAQHIWTLDDDCLPEAPTRLRPSYQETLIRQLSREVPADSWWNTIEDSGLYPRGYPYGIRHDFQSVAVHHGLWSGVPDLDGITALEHHALRLMPSWLIQRVPAGRFFPMCGMNLAFRREIAPAMYFGLQGAAFAKGERHREQEPAPLPFDRFDDIWAGVLAKKACDHLGYVVMSGSPSIIHTKESDPVQRVIREGPGIAAHEAFWRVIADASIPSHLDTAASVYDFLADIVECAAGDLPFPDYWRKLAEAMDIWTEFFT